MFGLFKRNQYSANATTLIGGDMAALVKLAAMIATDAIIEQKEAFEKERGINCSSDHVMRFATDDFVVGYAVGVATKQVLINGKKTK